MEGVEPSLRLQVATMRPEDSGRGLARLPRRLMSELGLAEGDVIELTGSRATAARAVGPYPEDEGLDIIRLDGLQRLNAGIGAGDLVELAKADPKPAKKVIFAPASKNLRLSGSLNALKRSFGMKPLTAGDVVATTGQQQISRGDIPPDLRNLLNTPAYALQEIRLVVKTAEPTGIVYIDSSTEVELRPELEETETPRSKVVLNAADVPRQSSVRGMYVSYAWGGDGSRQDQMREEIVDQLCAAAISHGVRVIRDKDALTVGDSISTFMRRLGASKRVFVILSEKYLKSPHCMFELHEIWRNARQDKSKFMKTIRVYRMEDANIFSPEDWVFWAVYWKEEYELLDKLARKHGAATLGEYGYRRLTQMQQFHANISNILGMISDTVLPRSFEELKRHGFEDVPY